MQKGVMETRKNPVMKNTFKETFLSGLKIALFLNKLCTPYLPISLVVPNIVCPMLIQMPRIRIIGRMKAVVPCQSTQGVWEGHEGKVW